MTGPVLRLTEWKPVEVDAGVARVLDGRRDWFDVTMPRFGAWQVRAKNVIGVVPLPGVTVRIASKLPVANLIGMIAQAHDLPSLALHQPEAPLDDVDGLLDHLARLFVTGVLARLRKGIFRSYVEDDDDLLFVRGRVDLAASARRAVAGDLRLHCAYEDLTADVMDNRILLAALHCLRRTAIPSDATRRRAQEAHRGLSGDVSLTPVRAADCVGRVYDRLNQDYRPLHAYARFFLEHTASDLGESSVGVPFTLNMAELFERFVAAWLREHLPPGLHLRVQHRLVAGNVGRFDSFVDLLLLDAAGRVRAVLDTKYKDASDPSRGDLHQAVYYATGLECRDAFLVYPSPAPGFDVPVGPKRVRSLVFDLGQPIESSGPAFLRTLLAALE